MIPWETLVELVGIATEPWGSHPWYRAAPPTTRSVETIQRELGVSIPPDYVRLAAACPSYGGWLAGIGEDYEQAYHILRLNAAFHDLDDPPALPRHLLLVNHGHDGDCDCWDTREIAESGEHPILYIDSQTGAPRPCAKRFESFRAYIQETALCHAPRSGQRGPRRRAKRLIEELKRGAGE